GVRRIAFCNGPTKAPRPAASGVPRWMKIEDGAATNFFGRKNSYSLARFVLAGPGRRWDTAARKSNHSVEWLAVPLFSNALLLLDRGSPLGTATPKIRVLPVGLFRLECPTFIWVGHFLFAL